MSKLAYAAAALAALSLTSTVALAQTAEPANPQRLALARQIFEAQGGAKNAEAAMRAVEKSMLDSAQTPEARDRMAKVMDATAEIFLPKMFDDMASYYAADFTEDQLKDVLAFYKSPTGQALTAKAPVLAQQIGGTMIKLMPKLQLKILDRLCSQSECNAQQKQQLASLEQAVPPDQRF